MNHLILINQHAPTHIDVPFNTSTPRHPYIQVEDHVQMYNSTLTHQHALSHEGQREDWTHLAHGNK